ncbi:MAG: ATP-binding cassette domain-containing protein, partial [Magnetococcales bacterium]|nr:ATP-binding cassette domain-containing protein [Magnetococcales bacterium]
KSSLLSWIAGVSHPLRIEGACLLSGVSVDALNDRERAATLGMLFQEQEGRLLSSRVEEEILLTARSLGRVGDRETERLQEVMAVVGLAPALLARSTHTLSPSERHCMALASVLAHRPRLLLLDEPDALLSDQRADALAQRLQRYTHHHAIATLTVTGRQCCARRFADRVLSLQRSEQV